MAKSQRPSVDSDLTDETVDSSRDCHTFRKHSKTMESKTKETEVNKQVDECVIVPDIEKLLERDSYLKPHEEEIRRR